MFLTTRLTQLSLSFSGSGFLSVYQIGAANCLMQHGAQFMGQVQRFAGASGGSLVATLLAIKPCKIEVVLEKFYDTTRKVRRQSLRSLAPGFHLSQEIQELLHELLPQDAHLLVRKKVYVSVSNLSQLRNSLFTEFDSKDELIQCLVCSCFIPVYDSFTLPRFRNKICVDGAYTCNLPRFPDGRTIAVTPFSGEPDISPQDNIEIQKIKFRGQLFCLNHLNALRLKRALFPPPLSTLEKYYEYGFADAKEFLKREGWFNSKPTNVSVLQ